MLENRLRRLVHGGHLACHDGRYFIGKRPFLHIARFFELFRGFILGRKRLVPSVRDSNNSSALIASDEPRRTS
jgi:hypothetical protein